MSCFIVVAQGEHDFSEGACPCGTEPPELGGKMAVERHVGTPECLNGTCACGTPKPEDGVPGPAKPDGDVAKWMARNWNEVLPPDEKMSVKERREGIATAVLAGWVAGDVQEDPERHAKIACAYADALIVELDK